MRKRCMSILLAFCMAWTLFPASTLAETSDGDAVPIIAEADATSPDETSAESAALSDTGDAMTRGAWMREMVNLFGLTLNKDEYPDVYFPDIAESEYFDDIMVATKFGLADVEAGDNFEPDAPLTRDFASHTLNFYLGIQNDRESYTYSDADSVVWRDDAQVAVDNGWLALSDGKFAPASDVTAEETATMLSFATETLNGRKVDESVANYAFSSYVKELPSDAEIKSTLDIDSGVTTLEISGYSGTLAANDTIVFYSDGFAFVYGVASVTESDGVLTVVTKEAPDDAIEQFEQVGETQPELEPYLPEDNEPVSLMAADGEMVTFDRVELLDAGKHKISYKRDFNKNGLSGKLSAEVTDISLKTNFIGDKRYVTLSGKITLSSTMELDFLNDDAAAQLFLGGIYIGKFGTLGLEINLKAAASIAYEYSAKFTVGVESLNGSKSLIHQLSASDTCITAKGTVSAKLALAARLEFGKVAKFYAGIGIGPTLSAKFKRYPSGTPQRCINLAGYLAADMEISAKLGKLKYEYTKDIYSESNSPLRVVEHIEDGVTVPACTRGKDSGTEESGYATPKYTTPTNSRYYASGLSNVSSTGYGGYGSAEPVVIWQTSDNGDGTVTITGYSGNVSILNIPETIDGKTVTAIGECVFQDKPLRVVSIPKTVTSIGNYAFSGCAELKNLSLPDNLLNIGGAAFQGTSLEEVWLPEGLTELGGEAFRDCALLQSVHIPSTLESVSNCYHNFGNHYYPFYGCEKLDNVTFGENVATIPAYLFQSCNGLTHIEIPETVTSIEYCAFDDCSNLKSVVIPKSVASVGNYAFYVCTSLESVGFPDALETIGGGAFQGCTALVDVKLPEGLTELGGEAFRDCASLQSVHIPSTLENVSNCYHNFGNHYYPFYGCEKLDNVTFGENIATIPAYLFQSCNGLTHIEIPETVTSIGYCAFDACPNLESIEIPNNVTHIDGYAFYGSGLKSIAIPDTVTEYADSILRDCSNLATAKLSKAAFEIPASMFSGCSDLTNIEMPDGIMEIKKNTFNGCSSLTNISFLPQSVTYIGDSAFQDCTGLTDAYLPELVSELGSSCFNGCTSLTTLKTNAHLRTIGDDCFYGCKNLSSVELNTGLEEIGGGAFQECSSLTSVSLPDSVTSIGWYAFQKDVSLKEIHLSSALTEIPAYALANCPSLEELVIPDGVTTIKDHSFYQDTKLKTFVIPASVSKIEDNAFSYPTTTTVYGVPGSYAETYAKWAAFLDIAQYRKTGTMGDAQELQWTYDPGGKTVTVTGAVNASAPVYVGSYDANGKMLSVKLITASNGAAQADDGANTVMLFWLDSNFIPKCGKATIRNA